MDLFSYIGNLFSQNNKKDKEEPEKQRKEAKDKLSKLLKEKCFMNENEIKQVLDIVDECFNKKDSYMKKYDYENSHETSSIDFMANLNKYNIKMKEELSKKIKEIMDAKLARAKKMFNKC